MDFNEAINYVLGELHTYFMESKQAGAPSIILDDLWSAIFYIEKAYMILNEDGDY